MNKHPAVKIIEQLRSEGHKALLAGGCVRDMLLDRPANDYDVATSARPDQITSIFKRTLKVGAKFGVIIVILDSQQVEVATFRTESGYDDGRHPTKVEFTDAAEDASRRDFTVNGMFYDPVTDKIIDYVNGQADLKSRIIRTIGGARKRFDEDYLRMLRAIRFSTQLDFDIEQLTWSAIYCNASKITEISSERITMELEGVLVAPHRSRGISMLSESGLASAIFPGFSGQKVQTAIKVLGNLPQKLDFMLGLAGFFSGCDTEYAFECSKLLRLSRNQNRHLKFLLLGKGKLLEDKMPVSQLKTILAEPYFDDLFEFQRAIQKAQRKTVASLNKLKKRIKDLGDVELQPKPIMNGNEIIKLGIAAGPVLGQLCREMYIAQLEGIVSCEKDARQWAEKWLKKHKTIDK